MILFFADHITPESAQLLEDEFKHCVKVLRHKVGDEVCITDGKGGRGKAIIKNLSKSAAELDVIHWDIVDAKEHTIILAIGPPKTRARWEWMLEKSTELGVDLILPFVGKHSERTRLNLSRSKKIIRSAALQSLRYYHPQIKDLENLTDVIAPYHDASVNKLVAHYRPENKHLLNADLLQKTSIIFIGPEGDFNIEEVKYFEESGFNMVNLGSNRLRTETAAVSAVNILSGLKFA